MKSSPSATTEDLESVFDFEYPKITTFPQTPSFEELLESAFSSDNPWYTQDYCEELPPLKQSEDTANIVESNFLAQKSEQYREEISWEITQQEINATLGDDAAMFIREEEQRQLIFSSEKQPKPEKVIDKDDDNYKYFPTLQWQVPRERYIRDELAKFLAVVESGKNIKVRGYGGSADPYLPTEQNHRRAEYLQLRKFSLFAGCPLADMKRGHHALWHKKQILRCLTLSDSKNKIVGAIYFDIWQDNAAISRCDVYRLEIQGAHQRHRYGSVLLQSAILTACLYGCEEVNLTPSSTATDFYLKHGFTNGIFCGLTLNFMSKVSMNLFIDKAILTSPTYPFKEKIINLQNSISIRKGGPFSCRL